MLEYWINKFRNLRVDRASKTPAPHKPLLLLTLLNLIKMGQITSPQIKLSPELAFHFLGYWEVVAGRGRSIGKIELPFFYLQSDGVFRHVAHDGLEAALASISPKSVNLLNKVINYAELPDELFVLMSNEESRVALQNSLIDGDCFFPEERIKLNLLTGREAVCPIQQQDDDSIVQKDINQGRDIRFRLQIVPLYGYRCLLCGVKMLLPSGVTLVEAAHIHPFSKSRNDDVTNGIALCRNHHWAFDQGLWTVEDKNNVIVAAFEFYEEAPNQLPLSAYHMKEISFTSLPQEHRPSQIHLEWHRKHIFLGNCHKR